mmetsp:Transcript_20748/g.58377  ORF Transcript_20748/g.58377 Transcript_20748/m.58377 type:complete len:1037 (-) Transcript_20748:75-3185(-)
MAVSALALLLACSLALAATSDFCNTTANPLQCKRSADPGVLLLQTKGALRQQAITPHLRPDEREHRHIQVVTKLLAGVPVHFRKEVGLEGKQEDTSALDQGEVKTWVIVLQQGSTNEDVHGFAQGLPGHARTVAEGHPSAGGLPIIVINATEAELEQELRDHPGARYVDEDQEMYLIPELPPEEEEKVEPVDDANGNDEPNLLQTAFDWRFWGLDRIDARLGRDASFNPLSTGAGVHVYVMDTGVQTGHSEFGGRAIPTLEVLGHEPRVCHPSDTSCADDNHGHGTHCSGTIAGKAGGVAPGATIHAVKVLTDKGSGSLSWLLEAIDLIVSMGERPAVFSMSLGGNGYMRSVEEAITQAMDAGITVVVSAGNNNNDACLMTPAAVSDAITVGSTTWQDVRSSFSNTGRCVDIFAPGSYIWSARNSGGFTYKSGTSMAAPHVAGAAALLYAENPLRSARDVKSLLLSKATPNVIADADGRSTGSPNLLLYVGTDPNVPTPAPAPCSHDGVFWHVSEGQCCIDVSDNCLVPPGYPGNYVNGEGCTIIVKDPNGLGSVSAYGFVTQRISDALSINGRAYSGSYGPRSVVPNGRIVWSVDSNNTRRGWRLCPDSPPAPTPAPTPVPITTTTATPSTTAPTTTPAPTPVPTTTTSTTTSTSTTTTALAPTPAPTTTQPPRDSKPTCHTVLEGEQCYDDVHWAKFVGIIQSPGQYPGLSPTSSFEDFQSHLHALWPWKCPLPCEAGARLCAAFGDPHFVTFDDAHTVLLRHQLLWLIRSQDVWLQALSKDPNGKLQAIAVGGPFMQGHKLIVRKTGPETLEATFDGKMILQQAVDMFSKPNIVTAYRGMSWNATMHNGDVLKVHTEHGFEFGAWPERFLRRPVGGIYLFKLPGDVEITLTGSAFMSVVIIMPPQSGGQAGYCGNFNGLAADDFTPVSPSWNRPAGEYLDAVGPSESLFREGEGVLSIEGQSPGPASELDPDSVLEGCSEALQAEARERCQAISDSRMHQDCIFDACAGGLASEADGVLDAGLLGAEVLAYQT